jgi:Zn-dependent membrane protease YugP
MIYAVLGIILLLAIYGPQWWIQWVMRRYSQDLADIPGTGGQFADHLIKRYQLEDVKVEETDPMRDHYDPQNKVVRLSPHNYHGKSLTAIAVAAHEVGHAIQFHRQEPISQLRMKYLPQVFLIKKLGIGILMFMPIITALIRVPHAAIIMGAAGVVAMLVSALMYLFILPEELDASFNKALPILTQGEYIKPEQETIVQKILKAAAYTYFAAALADILSLWRWIGYLKRFR